MASASDIKLPIVITANGSQAVAGLRAVGRETKKIESSAGRWGSSQLSAVGGMLSGYFGIGAAIQGLQELYQYANKIQGLSRQWSPEVAEAHGARLIAEQKRDQAVGIAVAPVAVEREKLATQMADPSMAIGGALLTEELALSWDRFTASLSLGVSAATAGTTADSVSLLKDMNRNMLGIFGVSNESADAFGASLAASSDFIFGPSEMGTAEEAWAAPSALEANAERSLKEAETMRILAEIAANTKGTR